MVFCIMYPSKKPTIIQWNVVHIFWLIVFFEKLTKLFSDNNKNVYNISKPFWTLSFEVQALRDIKIILHYLNQGTLILIDKALTQSSMRAKIYLKKKVLALAKRQRSEQLYKETKHTQKKLKYEQIGEPGLV